MRVIDFASVAAAMLLIGCDVGDKGGTSVSIDAGNGVATADGGTGEVTLDTPLIKGSFQLPTVQFTAENFDINGVHLYPGTKINAVNVNADGGAGEGLVRLRFESPASVDVVRDWLRAEFAKAGTSVSVNGNTLIGTTEDERFRIDLRPAGQQAAGSVTIGE